MILEEKLKLIEAAEEAEKAGNFVLAETLFDQVPLAPALGRGLAESIGYERAVALGVNFEEVDEAYGPDWHVGL